MRMTQCAGCDRCIVYAGSFRRGRAGSGRGDGERERHRRRMAGAPHVQHVVARTCGRTKRQPAVRRHVEAVAEGRHGAAGRCAQLEDGTGRDAAGQCDHRAWNRYARRRAKDGRRRTRNSGDRRGGDRRRRRWKRGGTGAAGHGDDRPQHRMGRVHPHGRGRSTRPCITSVRVVGPWQSAPRPACSRHADKRAAARCVPKTGSASRPLKHEQGGDTDKRASAR